MERGGRSAVNDTATVAREYASEERFLARRLATQADLSGPLVEDATVEALSRAGPERILEVGCGTGDFTERVQAEVGAVVVPTDLSLRMVQLTRSRGLPACMADTAALPFAAAEFDSVLANRVLYHLPDLDGGLAEIARVLRTDGALVAVTYSDTHLEELYELVGQSPGPSPFSAENGSAVLGRHFRRVERVDVAGTARFAEPEAVVALLGAHETFGYFAGVDVAALLAGVSFPFQATYRHALFVAR